MSWIKRLFSGREDPKDTHGYWVYVRCDRCGEALATRINLQNDLSLKYDNGRKNYFVRKLLVGSSGCFQRVEIKMSFDSKRVLVNREILGGEFITKEDYQQNLDVEP
jgi:hypothetical protein